MLEVSDAGSLGVHRWGVGCWATGAWQDQCIEKLSIDTGGQKVLSVGKARNLVIHWMG